jgi:hypothetical protein
VKVRVPELHGRDSASGIPDKDLPWCQIERPFGHGTQQEMSAFHMPQNDAIVKVRLQGNDIYSPLVSGAPYTVDGPIEEFGGDNIGSGNAGAFPNQHKHYGYKDPLGGLIHFDMDKKEITIDWTKYKKLHIKWPKTDIQVLNTYNDDSYPPDDFSGSGWGGGDAGSGGGGQNFGAPSAVARVRAPMQVPMRAVGATNGDCFGTAMTPEEQSGGGSKIPGDINWVIEGYEDKQIYGTYNKHVREDACDTFDKSYHLTVGQTWIIDVGGNVAFGVGGSMGLSISGSLTEGVGGSLGLTVGSGYNESSGSRSTSVGSSWSASAGDSTWAWLTSGSDLDD